VTTRLPFGNRMLRAHCTAVETARSADGVGPVGLPWSIRIDLAEARGYPSAEDLLRSNEWMFCPCGQLDPRVPRTRYEGLDGPVPGVPLDPELNHLGMLFPLYLRNCEWRLARETLAEIEARAAVVLNEVLGCECNGQESAIVSMCVPA